MGNAVTSMAEPFTQADSTEPLIRAEDVHKYYHLGDNRVHALRGVGLEIGRGEFVAVMGASGSGKSTFMKDRKSTRLNSSHRCISYAVFCLKKKTYLHED